MIDYMTHRITRRVRVVPKYLPRLQELNPSPEQYSLEISRNIVRHVMVFAHSWVGVWFDPFCSPEDPLEGD